MRVIIAHTLEHAQAALAAADECQCPIVLQSALGSIFYAGALYLLHLFETAKQSAPHIHTTCIIDCGNNEALAINAMQMGHTHIRVQDSESRIQDIAKQYGITVYTEAYEALDLLDTTDAKTACVKWLSLPS